MSLYNLFHAGGGTKDSAYMLDARVTRMVMSSEPVASVSHIGLDRNLLSDSNASKTLNFNLARYSFDKTNSSLAKENPLSSRGNSDFLVFIPLGWRNFV